MRSEPRAEALIDEFKDATGRLAIAISVDMLDTGIDVPEVVARKKGFDELNAFALREAGRRIVVLGACTGSDGSLSSSVA